MIDRRSVLSGLVGLSAAPGLAAARGGDEPWRDAPPTLRDAFRLNWGQPIEVRARSNPIKSDGHDIYIVHVGKATFDLGGDSRLTARLRAGVVQMARVDYWISAAVFDAEGRLLGAASHKEEVQRIMLGRVVTAFREISLDFGISKGYARAAFATIAVSERDLPDPPKGTA
jgi:hypothetical protein